MSNQQNDPPEAEGPLVVHHVSPLGTIRYYDPSEGEPPWPVPVEEE